MVAESNQGTFTVMRQLHGQTGKSIHTSESESIGSMATDGTKLELCKTAQGGLGSQG